LSEETGTFVPSLNQLKEIIVEPYRWRGAFYANGAAMLELDSTGLKSQAFAPKESFSFEKTYALLIPHLRSSREINYDNRDGIMFVSFLTADETDPSSFYLRDKDVMRTLMYGLRDKVMPSPDLFPKTHFEGVLTMYPLVPGDMPMPFIYPDYDRKAIAVAEGDTIDWEKRVERERRHPKALRELNGITEIPPEELIPIAEVAAQRKAEYFLAVEAFYGSTAEQDEGGAQASLPSLENEEQEMPSRPWLYVGILSALCAGAVFWLIRRKR